MSRARHHRKGGHVSSHHLKHHASGGAAETGNPHVFHLAHEGTSGTIHGDKAEDRMDRKRGGRAKHHATGGKSGSDMHPYTSAHAHGGHAGHHTASSKHHPHHAGGGHASEHHLHHGARSHAHGGHARGR